MFLHNFQKYMEFKPKYPELSSTIAPPHKFHWICNTRVSYTSNTVSDTDKHGGVPHTSVATALFTFALLSPW